MLSGARHIDSTPSGEQTSHSAFRSRVRLTCYPPSLLEGYYQSVNLCRSVGSSSTSPRSNVAHIQPGTCPISCQSHPYLTCFDMKRACPCFACVQIASWLFMPNLYVDLILDKPVHSFHNTAHLRSSGYWNEARARKCNDLCEPANNSSRHQASFWNACFHCITLNRLTLLWWCLVSQ